MTSQEFAQKIKTKFPTYQNVDDATLVSKMLEKYPTYKSQISDVQQEQQEPNYLQRVAQQYKEGGEKVINQLSKKKQTYPGEDIVNVAGAVAGAAFAPISAAIEPALKPVVQKLASIPGVADKIQAVSEWAKKHPDAATALQSVFDIGTLGAGGAVEKPVAGVVKDVALKTGEVAGKVASKVAQPVIKAAEGVANIAKDVVPTAERMVNYQVTRALDLTAGDIKNIAKSTGNEVGEFIAKNNLIGANKETTQKLVSDFYDTNYKTVRDEIGKVTKTYKIKEIPRFDEALKAIKKQINDVPGMQEANGEVNALLKKKVLTLEDVQRVKELMDEHFSLYKVTGDVGETVAKEGLANIRNDIKNYIENEVKTNTGADIATLNNNVATSKSITNAVTERSTRGLTRSNLRIGDLATFGGFSAALSPIGGLAAVAIKKAIESPTIRLRLAKWLDALSDARKLKALQELNKGKVPEEVAKIIQPKTTKNIMKQTKSKTISIK